MSVKFKKFFLLFSIFAVVAFAQPAKAEMDPRARALVIMSGYGTIGGALLGTASLAFGGSGRSVAKGASIGLYTGIVFGTYVVLSHYLQKQRSLNPEPIQDPYDEEGLEGEEEAGGGLFGVVPNWQEYENLERDSLSTQNKVSFFNKKTRKAAGPNFYLNVLNYQF